MAVGIQTTGASLRIGSTEYHPIYDGTVPIPPEALTGTIKVIALDGTSVDYHVQW